ncbi:MAG: nicotinamidase [Rhodospirillales bacterium]|nr:nicotinamidase [Rhodospirillales bacterium]
MIRLDPDRDILCVTDVQPTFMPGGELPIADGAAVVPIINRLLSEVFEHALATQDWHPTNHASFADSHPGHAPFSTVVMPYGPQTLWPRHAVQETSRAALHPALRTARLEIILRKGFRRQIDSYSAFFENDRTTPTGLDGYLNARGFRRLFFSGLATDFCVAWSAEDAARLGYTAFVIEDACRAIALPLPAGGTTLSTAHAHLTRLGVQFITSDALAPV